jgi:hypothetical protein
MSEDIDALAIEVQPHMHAIDAMLNRLRVNSTITYDEYFAYLDHVEVWRAIRDRAPEDSSVQRTWTQTLDVIAGMARKANIL